MTIGDNCPYCDSELENGFVVGSLVIWWTKKPPKVAITKKGGNIQLDRSYRGWAKLGAKRCDRCKLVIAEYS